MKRWIRLYLLLAGLGAHLLALVAWPLVDQRLGRKTLAEGIERAEAAYAERYPNVFAALGPFLQLAHYLQPNITRMQLPPLAEWRLHGANAARELMFPEYTVSGVPRRSVSGRFQLPPGYRRVRVDSAAELKRAVEKAQTGTVIEIAPGTYRFSGRSIGTQSGGTPNYPIVVRAQRFGDVRLEFDMLEGLMVSHPFWVFENLEIAGTCVNHDWCEHAFHVVGEGRGAIIRNVWLHEFNAPLKVNGYVDQSPPSIPDNGLLEYATLQNSTLRHTDKPVTLANINTANGWTVRRSIIADFAKGLSDQTSYAAFMKGNSSGGLFEQNLVICEQQVQAPGVRIGLSFGGGGTGDQFCRGQHCDTEHSGGTMRNNLILNCVTDVGIYLNKSLDTQVYNNLLAYTRGADVRYSQSLVSFFNNISDAEPREREGGIVFSENNLYTDACLSGGRCELGDWFADPRHADFRPAPRAKQRISLLGTPTAADFCGTPRTEPTPVGPFHYPLPPGCLPGR